MAGNEIASNVVERFATLLQNSADAFIWSVDQVPVERRQIRPPGPAHVLGEWTVVRHVFHMVFYERHVALPRMSLWLGAPSPSFEKGNEDEAWEEGRDLAALLAEFDALREEQVSLLSRFDATAWDDPLPTSWGNVTLRWVVSKTFQHTAEHTHDVMRIALFWDMVAARSTS